MDNNHDSWSLIHPADEQGPSSLIPGRNHSNAFALSSLSSLSSVASLVDSSPELLGEPRGCRRSAWRGMAAAVICVVRPPPTRGTYRPSQAAVCKPPSGVASAAVGYLPLLAPSGVAAAAG